MDNVLRLMEKPAEAKGLTLRVVVDDDVRAGVRGDPVRVAADPDQPGRQRDQVHGEGRRIGARQSPRRHFHASRIAVRGARYRHRAGAGTGGTFVPAIHAGRRIGHSPLRRYRPRPDHLQETGRPDGRQDRRALGSGTGFGVLVLDTVREIAGRHRRLAPRPYRLAHAARVRRRLCATRGPDARRHRVGNHPCRRHRRRPETIAAGRTLGPRFFLRAAGDRRQQPRMAIPPHCCATCCAIRNSRTCAYWHWVAWRQATRASPASAATWTTPACARRCSSCSACRNAVVRNRCWVGARRKPPMRRKSNYADACCWSKTIPSTSRSRGDCWSAWV